MNNLLSESKIQDILYKRLLYSKHPLLCAPNVYLYSWESDLIQITKSMFVHEFEIKISKQDFLNDFKKESKHQLLECGKRKSKNS